MKKALILAFSIAGLMFSASNALADEKEKTIKGEGQCGKCSLKKAESCQNVIVAKVDGKEVVYWLKDAEGKDVNKKFHGKVCQGKKAVKASGTVKEEDGKHILIVAKIELDEKD